MTKRARSGNTLVIVLALALLLAAQLSIVSTLNSGNIRQLARVTANVRAATVAESAFARILARIKGVPWSDRWFAAAPVLENDAPLVGGAYSSFVATVPTTAEHLADVWIRGRYDGAIAVMYWRVKVIEDTLDFRARVYPQFFTHLPGDAAAPTGAPGDPTRAVVETMVATQRTNRPGTITTLRGLDPIPNLPGIIAGLGVPAVGVPVDTRQGVTPLLPQPTYITDVRLPSNFPPLPSAPPPLLVTPPPPELADANQQESDSDNERQNDGGSRGGDGRGEGEGGDREGGGED